MAAQRGEKILVVDDDPETTDLLVRQVLGALGYRMASAADGAGGLQTALKFLPDVVILSLALPGISGKDVLTGLRSQGNDSPVIVVAPKGQETQVIAAFRLGANDYLVKPLREAEVVSAVDRAVAQVRLRGEREQLAARLQAANAQLERRVKELTALYGIGKTVTSITDLEQLLARTLEGALFVTEAEAGWILLADEKSGQLILRGGKGLPPGAMARLHQPWDDGLAPLVMQSGEALIISGAALEQFKVAQLVKAALVAPIKVRNQSIGVIAVGNRKAKSFSERDQAMLSAVTDYVSIAIVNARLFQAVAERARSLQQAYDDLHSGDKIKDQMMQNVSHELRTPLIHAQGYADMLRSGQMGRLTPEQSEAVGIVADKLRAVVRLVENMAVFSDADTRPENPETAAMVDLTQQAVARHQAAAQQVGAVLAAEFPRESPLVIVDQARIGKVLDELLDNALKFSPRGGQVTVRVRDAGDGNVEVMVGDAGAGIEKDKLPRVFERFYQADGSTTRKFGGVGLGLSVVRQIVEAHSGRVWADSAPGKGSRFYFTLPKSG